MTTFAAAASKTGSSPLFAMFPPAGGTSSMKSFSFSGSTEEASDASPAAAAASSSSSAAPLAEPVAAPVRPSRHIHHAAQWTETKTLGPGLVVRSTTATVSQWSEFQQTTETISSSVRSSTQFQTIRTVQQSSSADVLTPAEYLDDLQLPVQHLDVGAQLVKSSMCRKGSLGGRRPPTVKMRRSSHALLAEQSAAGDDAFASHQDDDPVSTSTPTPAAQNQTEAPLRNGPVKIPPPRPPPPVFNRPPPPPPPDPHQPSDDWSRSATPPSLPPSSPPPLPVRDELDFVLEKGSGASTSTESFELSPRPSVMTDVVEINDKESIDDDGEVVRRRTIITLGQKVIAPSGGSSGSINVTLLNNGPSESVKKDADPAVEEDSSPRPVGRASAFNARRTIELRRQQQHLDNNPIQRQPVTAAAAESQEVPITKAPSSTYLFGERGSPASSFGGSSLRTVSISMSFDDLESNASEKKGPTAGRNRSEAWYERRQSYGFEAADKLQSLLNTSGSSDVPSTGAISRSCDSLSSTVRSTSSQIEKMIPPWLKNQSPGRPAEEEDAKSSIGQVSSRMSYFGESIEDILSTSGRAPEVKADDRRDPSPPPPITPTPSVQRSESSRSASNLTGDAEPAWLRDLKMRRSLRDNRRQPPTPPVKQDVSAGAPVWLNVKLRPTGLNLIDPDPAEEQAKPSPTKPTLTPIFTFINTKQTSKLQQHLRNSLENMLDDPVSNNNNNINNNVNIIKSNEPEIEHRTPPKESNNNVNHPVKKSSSVVIVNSSRESVHSDSTSVKSAPADHAVGSSLTNRLHHHRSIELMRMLEETPLVTANGVNYDRTESGSVFTDVASVYSMGEECNSTVKSSNEDLTGAQPEARKKKVAFGADVKEESDRGRSRPRRIRSRSPETRLRQWQEKLEEVKSFHSEVTTTTTTTTTTESRVFADSKPLKHFGDEQQEEDKAETAPTAAASDSFRSLLLPRKPYVIGPVKESVVIDSYPLMRAASGPADLGRNIRNGIVNFDSSVERKIVILETENAPAPKSILKKRSLENLLDSSIVNPPVPIVVPATTIAPPIHSGIKVSITNQKKEPPPVIEQEVRPWRIHLKHVDPPLRIKSPEREPTPPIESWKMEANRRKTPPPLRSATPENFFRGRSPSTASESSASIPGIQAAELIRNLRNPQQPPPPQPTPTPVMMMVARCEVKESTYKQPLVEPELSAKTDHGYHSLEADAETGSVKKVRNEFKAIDETIAKLNETIEEIRSVNVLTDDNPLVIRENPAEKTPPSANSNKSDNRYFIREIRPSRSASRIHPIVDGHIPTITPIRMRTEPTRSASLGSHYPINPINYPLRRHSSGTYPSNVPHSSGAVQPLKVAPVAGSTVYRSSSHVTTQTGVMRPESPRPEEATVPERSASRSPSPDVRRPAESGGADVEPQQDDPARVVTAPSERIGVREADVEPERPSDELLFEQHHVKDLVQTFENARPERSASVAECGRKLSTESLRSVSSVSSVSSLSCGRLRSTIQSMQKPFSSAPASPSVPNKQPQQQQQHQQQQQPEKKDKPVELTSGMPEDKAAILIRKYFGTASVIETTKSRMAETIHEETSDISSTVTTDEKRVMNITEISFDSEDFFNVESGTELMSSSSFGSALDNLESTDDDRASVNTTASSSKASSTTVTSMRYSSCSERSVKLSDIINRPEKPRAAELTASASTSLASGSIRSTASRRTTSSTSSSSSTSTLDQRNGSVRRNKPRRYPTVIKKDKSPVKETPKSPKPPARTRAAASTARAPSSRSSTPSAPVIAPPRRSSANKALKSDVSSSTAPQTAPPPRPLRPVQPPSPVKKASSRPMTSGTSRSSVVSSAKIPSASAPRTLSAAKTAISDKKVSSTTNGQVHSATTSTKSNKLVTITSYNSRGVATKPEEAVSGIKVTPVAVGSGHYKIRMEQRLASTVTTGSHRVSSSSQKTAALKMATSSLASRRLVSSSSSSRKAQ